MKGTVSMDSFKKNVSLYARENKKLIKIWTKQLASQNDFANASLLNDMINEAKGKVFAACYFGNLLGLNVSNKV